MKTARIIVAAIAMLFASSAEAQMKAPCVPRAALVQQMFDQWNEVPVVAGIVRGGALAMELLVSPKRTFTIIHVQPLGDCAWIVSAGSDLMITGDVPMSGEKM